MSVRVLCAGDIHIGRQTSKTQVPYRTADAWLAIVDLAILEKPDLVAISGDIIDKVGKSYESLGPLVAGLKRLEIAGIKIVAVTGNHDHDVLAALSRQPGFGHLQMLGLGGRWEHIVIERNAEPVLTVLGWSFPHEHVDISPLLDVPRIDRGELPVLGIVHADVGSESSRYGPATLNQFRGHDVDFWLLGHIHKPQHFAPDNVLYPGSPYAMDPGEPGVHGVWMLTLEAGQPPLLQQIPLAPVEYRTVDVDVSAVTDEIDFQGAAMAAIDRIGVSVLAEQESVLKEISLRLRFTGTSLLHQEMPKMAQRFQQESGNHLAGLIPVTIDSVDTFVLPPVDLKQLALGNDPAAELANLLLALDHDELNEPYRSLMESIESELSQISRHSNFARLDAVETTPADARTLIRDQSWTLLSALIGTRMSA